MARLVRISIFVIVLFAAFQLQSQAQTPPPAAAQKTDKPKLDADKLAIDWVDRMNALSTWYLKVDGAQKVVDNMMQLFTPDVIAEVPPHDERQQGPVQLIGAAQVRRWVEKIAKTEVDIKYVIKRQTMKEFEGERSEERRVGKE